MPENIPNRMLNKIPEGMPNKMLKYLLNKN
jgi:hypothetical protein